MLDNKSTYLLLDFFNISIIFEIKFKTSLKSEHNRVSLDLISIKGSIS